MEHQNAGKANPNSLSPILGWCCSQDRRAAARVVLEQGPELRQFVQARSLASSATAPLVDWARRCLKTRWRPCVVHAVEDFDRSTRLILFVADPTCSVSCARIRRRSTGTREMRLPQQRRRAWLALKCSTFHPARTRLDHAFSCGCLLFA